MTPVFWTIKDILTATGGAKAGGPDDAGFSGIAIDSRTAGESDLFVAVQGETHDGHRFIADVVKKGVLGIVMARQKYGAEVRVPGNVVCILVDDTIQALGDLAAFHRRRFDVRVAAITGSNGKTTTKEMTASVLSRKFKTLKTAGNLNNHFGLPLTLFGLDPSHEAAVVELGMNHPGEIRRLSAICRPDIGVITNIGPAHLEGLGGIEDVMAAKGELIENIADNGTIVLNADDACCVKLGAAAARQVFFFGFSDAAAVRAVHVTPRGNHTVFTLVLPDAEISVALKAPGEFMVRNALAAAAAGHLNGLSADAVKAGLEGFSPVKGRMDIKKTRHGVFIIDGTYNANPGSMEAAIRTLIQLKGGGRGILVAGDMMELGKNSEALHEAMGGLAARLGLEKIFHTGTFAPAVKTGACREGMAAHQVFMGDKSDVTAALLEFIRPGDWVLVKGSRGAEMENIVRRLEAFDEPAI